jgi:ATP-binding cassette subfamily C protein
VASEKDYISNERKTMKRVRTPTVIQMESLECGAAALCSILGYFGRYVPLEQLRIDCGISRDGSLVSNMLMAARNYGLDTEERILKADGLPHLPVPFIIGWHLNHFVVVEGFSKKNVYINDPAIGPRTVSWKEIEVQFTGKTLLFKPNASFRKEGKPQPFMRMILKRFSGAELSLTYLFIAGLFLLVPGIALPTFTRYFVDAILQTHLSSTAALFIFTMVCSMLIAGVLTALQGYALSRLNAKISIRLSSQFLWHILRLPVEFYVQRHGGEIAYRLTANDKAVTTLTVELARSFINLLLIVAYGTLLFFYDATVALIGVAAGLLNLIILMAINRIRTDANIRLQQDMGQRVGMSIGGLQNIETLKATSSESAFFSRWAGYFAKTVSAAQEIGKLDIYLAVIPPFTQFLAATAVLTLGGMRVIEGKMTLGMLLGLQTLMQTFLLPISQFVYLSQRVQNVKGSLYRLDDVLSNPIDPQLVSSQATSEEPKLSGELKVEKMTFGYNFLAPPLIENFDLHITPGQSIALVGPSGCGKSTIGRLITGLYKPWSGEIFYDGKLYDRINRQILNRSVASVEQRIYLFGGTVRENLTLWDTTIPEEDVVQGAIDAEVHADILRREAGYESEVLEGGRNFSAGQLQCLEIARVLALNPTFLVLDEATSFLDSDTETKIIKKIRQRGCSCLVISHRLSTIRDCDEIIILEKGKVVHRGTHDTLKKESELYQELVRLEGAL